MKAKTTKKALSLLLAILMLFLIFPIGVISVGADTVTYDYTITDMASWNEVANNNTTYKSAKIKIDADITLTEDFVFPLFTDFAGTLDGAKSATENYTLSAAENFTINSARDNCGVIADEISGDASITNLNFKDLSLNSDNKCHAIVAGQVNAKGKTISIQNISIDSCSITTKSSKYYVGAIFGNIAKGSVELDDINIKDTTVNGGIEAAFVTGGHHGTSLNINNLTVTGGSVIASSHTIGIGIGGSAVVGKIGNGPSLVVTNSSVTGMTLQGDGASGKGVCLGFYVGYSIGTSTGSNVTIDGCSVENCTISNANSPSGGIAGELGGGTVGDRLEKITVTNVTVSDNNAEGATGGLIGKYTIPKADSTSALTVKGVTLDTVTVENTAGHAGGIVGTMNGVNEDTFENIKINGLTLSGKGFDGNDEGTEEADNNLNVGSGGLIGVNKPAATPYTLNVNNVSITASSITDTAAYAGGIIGVTTKVTRAAGSTDADVPVTHNINISNVYIDDTTTITSNGTDASHGAGGIFGACGERNSTDTTWSYVTNLGTINVTSCVVQGTVTATKRAGGISAYYGYMASTLNVKNCLIDLTELEGPAGKALLLARGLRLYKNGDKCTEINVSDCITTNEETYIILDVSAESSVPVKYNGKDCIVGNTFDIIYVNENQYNLYDDKGTTETEVKKASGFIRATDGEGNKALFELNEDGYVAYVRGHVTSGYWQAPLTAKQAGETYSIRVIAVTMIDITDSDFGIKIVVKDTAGNTIHDYSEDNLTFELYDGLNAYSAEEGLEKVSASEDFGGKKFIAAVINGIPAGEAYNIEVTPYVGATEYVTHTIMIGADGQPA